MGRFVCFLSIKLVSASVYLFLFSYLRGVVYLILYRKDWGLSGVQRGVEGVRSQDGIWMGGRDER